MRGLKLFIVGIFLLSLFPALSIPISSQDDAYPLWNPEYREWPYRQEIQVPISTNDSTAHGQPIDLLVIFEKLCWSENENLTSIRVSCWYAEQWHNMDSQIHTLVKNNGKQGYISECNIVFLIPSFADGTERFFIYALT